MSLTLHCAILHPKHILSLFKIYIGTLHVLQSMIFDKHVGYFKYPAVSKVDVSEIRLLLKARNNQMSFILMKTICGVALKLMKVWLRCATQLQYVWWSGRTGMGWSAENERTACQSSSPVVFLSAGPGVSCTWRWSDMVPGGLRLHAVLLLTVFSHVCLSYPNVTGQTWG